MLRKQLSRKFDKEVTNFPLLPAFGSESVPNLERLRVIDNLDMDKAVLAPKPSQVGGNLERKFMQAQLKPRLPHSPANPPAPSKKENHAPVGPQRREEEVFFKVKPAISKVQLKTSASMIQLQKPRPASGGFSLRNLNSTPAAKIPSSAIKETPALRSTAELRKKGSEDINIREAIRLNDHVRIRKGSPGSHSQGKSLPTFVIGGADRYKTLDQTTIARKNFDQEMQEKGIMSEIKDLSRFSYVLATRCSPRHLEEEHRSQTEC